MIRKVLAGVLICGLGFQSQAKNGPQTHADSVLKMMNKVARWQMNEWKEGRIIKLPKTEWENGAMYAGFVALKQIDKSPAYDQFLYDIGEELKWNTGPVRLFADDYVIAQMYTAMYLEHKAPKMIAKWQALADTIVNKPFNESLKVVPNINHREWAWCDALFMGPPAMAMLSAATDDLKYLKKADTLWWKTSAYLYDKNERLYYRDSRFFERREANGKKVFWSRGNGWVLAGLARMMDHMPAGFESRPLYQEQFKEMAAKIASLQQADGSWHASLYDPVTFNLKESSATGFFCYGITWGINNGLLPRKEYLPVVERAWAALRSSVHPNGKLGYVQPIGDKPVKAGYESTDVYGVGAFLLAGSELYKLYAHQATPEPLVYPTVSLNAEWIACPDVDLKDYGVYHLRKTFELAEKPARFVVHLTGDQRYRLYVNGVPVVLGSARGDLRNWYYETVDIAPHLKAGKNVLAVLLWNMGSGAPAAQVSFQTGFILQGNGEKEKIVNTDKTWKVIKNEAYFPEPFPPSRLASYIVGSCDSLVFKKHPFGWEGPAYDDSHWQVPVAEPKPRYFNVKRNLLPRTIPLMEETAGPITGIVRVQNLDAQSILKTFNQKGSITIPAHTRATILFDIKALTTAYPEITFSQGENARVRITYAESLFDERNLKGNRNQVEGKHIKGYYDVFLADGGSNRLFRPLWMRTFRYIQFDIETRGTALTLNKLESVFTAYPFKENGSFSSSDASLSDIWKVGWRTARLCANETYMDCPYYEQLQYVGDTRIQALISLYVSGDDRLVRNAIEQFHQSRVPDGLTRDAYPAGGGKFIPPFSLFWISMVYDYAWYRDDKAFIDKYMIPVESILKWFEYRLDPQTGLLGKTDYWNFVDWTFSPSGIPSGGIDGNSSILSLHYAYTLDQAATLFEQTGQAQKSAYYRALAQKIKAAVYKTCYDAEKQLLADSPDKKVFSQHANIWGILSDCIPPAQQQGVMARVMNDSTLISSTLYFRFYYTAALKKAGMGNLYLSTLGPWKEMLSLGLSTFPETLSPTVRSDCHAWSASPCYDFLATVCGIEPAAPGFVSVRIAPNLGGLKEASGEMPHPLGPIRVRYQKSRGGAYLADIELPAAMKGEFIAGGQKTVLTGGKQRLSFK